MKIIKARQEVKGVKFDSSWSGFVPPTIWGVKGGPGRKITINFVAQGYTEKRLREEEWGGVDGIPPFDTNTEEATVRYFRHHSIREVLSGDNPSVIPASVRVNDCAMLVVDLEVKRNLKIERALYIDQGCGIFSLEFEVVVWDDRGCPIEKYTIECPYLDDIVITEYQNNGKGMPRWPVKETYRIYDPKNHEDDTDDADVTDL